MIIGEKMTPKEIFNILEREMGSMPQEEKALQEWFETSYNTGNEAVQKALIELLTYDVIRPESDDDKILYPVHIACSEFNESLTQEPFFRNPRLIIEEE